MKETLMYAQYNEAATKAVYDLISTFGNEDREKDRGSYYGSLSGLFRHIIGGTWYFLGMFRETLANNAAAVQALSAMGSVSLPEGTLNDAQWKELDAVRKTLDSAYIGMAEALTDADMALPVKVEWYGGNPATVPLRFMLSQLLVHNTHHRGQVSQILDSLKIENDYSGINVAFLPRK